MNGWIIGLAVVAAAPAPKDAPTKESPTLHREWVADSSVRNGNPMPTRGLGFTFENDGTFVIKEGAQELAAHFTIDPKKEPAEIDLEFQGGAKPLIGIYKMEDDKLTLCLVVGALDRPRSFESPAGGKTWLVTLKRVKKK